MEADEYTPIYFYILACYIEPLHILPNLAHQIGI